MTNEKIVTVFKAFSDESRVEIIALLKNGELCGNSILEKMKISQSTLSHHMKILCESGIVTGRRDGKWTYYSVNAKGKEEAVQMLNTILDAKDIKAEPQAGSAKTTTSEKAAVKKTVSKTAAKKVTKAAQKKTAKALPKKAAAAKPAPKAAPKEEQKPERSNQLESWLL